jgi:hypothetical protein
MPIPEEILKGLKCCLSEDGHFIYEPVSLKCGGNPCRKCINEDLERKNSIISRIFMINKITGILKSMF